MRISRTHTTTTFLSKSQVMGSEIRSEVYFRNKTRSANIELSTCIATILLCFGLGTRKSQIECHHQDQIDLGCYCNGHTNSASVITSYSEHVSRVMTRPRCRAEAGRGGRYIIRHQVFNQSVPPGCHRRRRTLANSGHIRVEYAISPSFTAPTAVQYGIYLIQISIGF